MRWTAAAVPALILCCSASAAGAERAPVSDPAFLNIGLECRWDDHCMTTQRKAMAHALGYVRKARPPASRIQQCNRNARRGYQRVDWIGFDHCIRNRRLIPHAPLPRPRR